MGFRSFSASVKVYTRACSYCTSYYWSIQCVLGSKKPNSLSLSKFLSPFSPEASNFRVCCRHEIEDEIKNFPRLSSCLDQLKEEHQLAVSISTSEKTRLKFSKRDHGCCCKLETRLLFLANLERRILKHSTVHYMSLFPVIDARVSLNPLHLSMY